MVVRLARSTTDTADADGVGSEVAAACLAASPATILSWLAILTSLKARRIGLDDGMDVNVPEGMPTSVVKGGRLVVGGLIVAVSDTSEPATLASPNLG